MSSEEVQELGIAASERQRIVVVGGGFAGLNCVRKLDKSMYQVVLLDSRNHHTFQHLLYQVATSELEADAIAYPLRKLHKKTGNVQFRMAKATRVDPGNNRLYTDRGSVGFDYLVLASGAMTSFFGIDSVARNALPMKSLPEALSIRNRLLKNLEEAQFTQDDDEKRKLATIVIAGGGPTGVETAGAMAEFKNYIMASDYADMDCDLCSIHLIEMQPRLLGSMSEKASRAAHGYLEKMGVDIMTGTRIEAFDGERVITDQGEIASRILIWTGGVAGAALEGLGEDLVDDTGRIAVDAFTRVKGYENIYAVGDVARVSSEQYPGGHPQLAAVAVQQGKYLAERFNGLGESQSAEPFVYKDKGVMANIGRSKGIAELPSGKTFKGFLPWLGWLAVHLYYLAGIKNRIITGVTWFWFALRKDMASRIILDDR